MAHRAPFSRAICISLFLVGHLFCSCGGVANVHPHVLTVLGSLQVPTGLVDGKRVLARWYLQSSASARIVLSAPISQRFLRFAITMPTDPRNCLRFPARRQSNAALLAVCDFKLRCPSPKFLLSAESLAIWLCSGGV